MEQESKDAPPAELTITEAEAKSGIVLWKGKKVQLPSLDSEVLIGLVEEELKASKTPDRHCCSKDTHGCGPLPSLRKAS